MAVDAYVPCVTQWNGGLEDSLAIGNNRLQACQAFQHGGHDTRLRLHLMNELCDNDCRKDKY